eukprot:TRINITY_DN5336_c0_g1_i1.p1 TRINITY_DN5336_c0_g1~~TRINITY_DN5336_c0_g1_i1.p1  ORF type:complete len:839 (+),score=312.08 TRINITY_DN5336_c0_g1_i1:99-2615(+)
MEKNEKKIMKNSVESLSIEEDFEEKEEEECFIHNLSVELLDLIFYRLEPIDLVECRDVCSYWREIISSSPIWKNLPFTQSSLRVVLIAELEKLIYYNKNALLCDNSDDSSHTFQGFLFATVSNALEENELNPLEWMENALLTQSQITKKKSIENPIDSSEKSKERQRNVLIFKLREASIKHFEKGEELNEKNVMCWMNHGYFCFKWGRMSEAKYCFRMISSKFTREEAEVSYYYNVGYTHYRLNDDSNAIQNFKKSLELYPLKFSSNSYPPTIEFPTEYANQRRKEIERLIESGVDLSSNVYTLSLLQKITKEDSESSKPHSNSSDCSSKKENKKKAIDLNECGFLDDLGRGKREKQRKGLESDSFESPISLARCFNHIATSFQFLDKNDEAFEFYSKALAENYDLPNVHYGLAWLYNSNRNSEKARYHFEKAIELNPLHIHALTKLGWVYQEAGDEKLARQFFQKSLELDEQYAPAQNGMADTFVYDIALLADNMRAKESIEQLMKLLEKYPKYSNGYILLGTLYYTELEQFGDSLKAFQKAVELAPNKKLCYEIAKCHYMLGNHSEAMKELQEELRLIEECINFHVICHVNTNGSLKASHVRQLTKVHTLMGDLYQIQGDYEEARKHYTKAIECNPTYKTVYLGLATLHTKMKNYKAATQCFEDAIQITEYNHSDIVQWSANRRLGWGGNNYAVSLFEKIMRISPLHIQIHREWANMIQEEINELTKEMEGFQSSRVEILNPSFYRSHLSVSFSSPVLHHGLREDRGEDRYNSIISSLIKERDDHQTKAEKLRIDLIYWCGELSEILFKIGKTEEAEGWKERTNRVSRTVNFYVPR